VDGRAPDRAVAIGGGYGSLMRLSPWPQATTLRHVAAAPGCTFAGLVSLAPSVRGEPGYYAHLDADADGRSCEASTGGRGGFRHGRRRRR
jgi:hypothetical protein